MIRAKQELERLEFVELEDVGKDHPYDYRAKRRGQSYIDAEAVEREWTNILQTAEDCALAYADLLDDVGAGRLTPEEAQTI